MRVDLLTKEYPPFIYGGAGVHVNELAKVLRPLADLDPELPLGEHTVREYLARCDSTGIEPVTHPDWHPTPNPGDNHAP